MANKSKPAAPAQPEVPVATIEHEASALEEFVDEHKSRILWGIIAVLAIVVGTMVFKYRSESNFSAAAGVLTGAETIEELRKVVSDYPGEVVAGSALLIIADKLESEEEKVAELKKFVDGYQGHPLHAKGRADLALIEQENGNFDDAISVLREITSADKKGFTAQNGLLRLGDALTAKGLAAMKEGDVDGAKKLFEEAKLALDDLEDRTPSEGLKRTLTERRERLPHLSVLSTTPEAAAAKKAEEEAAAAKKTEEKAAAAKAAAEEAATVPVVPAVEEKVAPAPEGQ